MRYSASCDLYSKKPAGVNVQRYCVRFDLMFMRVSGVGAQARGLDRTLGWEPVCGVGMARAVARDAMPMSRIRTWTPGVC